MDDDQVHAMQAERRRLEADLFSLETVVSRAKRHRDDMVIDMRRIKNDIARLGVTLQEKEKGMESLEHDITESETEISQIKKKMNLLH